MTLEKAIKILKGKAHQHVFIVTLDTITALNLGIEALKRVEYMREAGYIIAKEILPGEAEE